MRLSWVFGRSQRPCSDPQMLETAYIAVITFGDIQAHAIQLTEVLDFQIPTFALRGGACLGAAIRTLADAVDREVVKPTSGLKGDWTPIVFVFLTSDPVDDWTGAAKAYRAGHRGAPHRLAGRSRSVPKHRPTSPVAREPFGYIYSLG